MNKGIIATIGFFDGVHKGHQSLMQNLVDVASQRGLRSMIITFDRHPREVFAPTDVPSLLTTLDEKVELLKKCGIDSVNILPFDARLAALAAHDFMRDILRDALGVSVLAVGYDHRFGRPIKIPLHPDSPNGELRDETFDDYYRYGDELGIEVIRFKELSGNVHISSSVIRRALAAGELERANTCLGHLYTLGGKVVHGRAIGHRLGFPTANIEVDCPAKLIPLNGVYAAWADLSDHWRIPAVINIGTRPTFSGSEISIEAHLLRFDGNLYGQHLVLSLVSRIRPERRFASEGDLCRQLEHDQVLAEKLLKEDTIL